MRFSFDATKSLANKEKHGIDFVEAQELWRDEHCVLLPARSASEERDMLIAEWHEKKWTAIITERGTTIRLISVRRSRKHEEEFYEKRRIARSL